MQPFWTSHNGETKLTLYQGDVLDVLRQLPAESVHCCITSPPYWGLRDYGVVGQIGLEETPDEYVEKMVQVFREVRRVLRQDGTLWLNLGDSYAGSTMSGGDGSASTLVGTHHRRRTDSPRLHGHRRISPGLKPKDLVGIPWMVAFALRDDGWYLRADIVWAKPNPMPESVTDRPTKSHEYVFLLSKSPRYYYDADAIREPHTSSVDPSKLVGWQEARRGAGASEKVGDASSYANGRDRTRTLRQPGGGKVYLGNPAGRNKRSVWWIATEPFPESHFAVFPTALVEPMILAGTSPRACPHCGAPWRRVVDKERVKVSDSPRYKGVTMRNDADDARYTSLRREMGWRPTCSCPDNDGSGRCVVLDPFNGSGTTMLVAQRLGRSAIGIELNPEYCNIARRRLEKEHLQVRLPVFD